MGKGQVKVAQLCLTLDDHMDYTVHGILQALILKWVAFLLQGDQTVFLEFLLDCLYLVAQSCPTLCDPMDYTVHGILQARILEWVAIPFFKGLPNPGIKPVSPVLQVNSLPAELPGKPFI